MRGDVTPLKGVFVFSATIIGAGILALPLVAAGSGLIPLILVLIVIGVVSIFSALYIAETVLNTKGDHHLPTLAKEHLGKNGFYLMLLGIIIYIYGALTGYLSIGGQMFNFLFGIPLWQGMIIYFLIASIIVHLGLKIISYVETYLFILMLFLIGAILIIALPKVHVPLLVQANWSSTLSVFGVVLFAYVGHSVIPSIADGLKNKKDINKVAVWGVLIPLILYVLWSIAVIGNVPPIAPEGLPSLSAAAASGQPATTPLGVMVGGSIILLGSIFAVLSTMTAYIGFGFSLKDVYADTAQSLKQKISNITTTLAVVIPPLIIAMFNPEGFLDALKIAGTYGGGLFVGILPVLIVIQSRKNNKKNKKIITWGGQWMPYLVLSIYLIGMLYTTIKLFF
ncbi:amino acid permease [Candidatus Woesearchaeota archaeon]|nr:amino acid permease [Candidatus Woesearchaeota archaeon]